jgi:hypothetical protein
MAARDMYLIQNMAAEPLVNQWHARDCPTAPATAPEEMHAADEAETTKFARQQGDVPAHADILTAHGRAPYAGCGSSSSV